MNPYFIIGIVFASVIIAGGFMGVRAWQLSDPEVVSTSGIHWHPTLTLYVQGVQQEISANIGISRGDMSIHTHEPDGTIHLEMPGTVRKADITLENFFKAWGKDINSFGSTMTITVNGEANTELGAYQMKNGDKIELRYE